jgi:DNA-binding CsgD family transcriptional regulator
MTVMAREAKELIERVLTEIEARCNTAVSIKDSKGIYTYANEGWSGLAEAPIHKITGRRDDELPWGARDGRLILSMDATTRKKKRVKRVDRLAHFQQKVWMHTTTERLYVPDEDVIVCVVQPSEADDFCRLANQVTADGIVFNGLTLSIKQMYLLHQLLFQVPQKQTARELGCSTTRINQYLRELRDMFEAEDSKELICALSANGLFPLLERFELLFRQQWVPTELKFH